MRKQVRFRRFCRDQCYYRFPRRQLSLMGRVEVPRKSKAAAAAAAGVRVSFSNDRSIWDENFVPSVSPPE